MTNLPLPRLQALLRAAAKGLYAAEAATELLIAHDVWLQRDDFLQRCVWLDEVDGTRVAADVPVDDDVVYAGIRWDAVSDFIEHAPCSGSEARILRIAAELAGTDSGIPLAELLSSLDEHRSQLVLDAIAYTSRVGVYEFAEAIDWPPAPLP